jgi:hypothetical protein
LALHFFIRPLFGKNCNNNNNIDYDYDDDNGDDDACASKGIYVIRRRPVNENLWV